MSSLCVIISPQKLTKAPAALLKKHIKRAASHLNSRLVLIAPILETSVYEPGMHVELNNHIYVSQW